MKLLALVSGANRGLGLEIARALSHTPNISVLLGSRDAAAGEDQAKESET